MVDEITRAIGGMLAAAKNPATQLELTVKPRAEGSYLCVARLDGQKVESTVAVKDYLWSPADYTPWASQLLAAWQIKPSSGAAADYSILQTLTNPTPGTLQREGKRLTTALNATPLDATLHEQSALLIAAFALREAAGEFTEPRRELSRIAAHLAIA